MGKFLNYFNRSYTSKLKEPRNQDNSIYGKHRIRGKEYETRPFEKNNTNTDDNYRVPLEDKVVHEEYKKSTAENANDDIIGFAFHLARKMDQSNPKLNASREETLRRFLTFHAMEIDLTNTDQLNDKIQDNSDFSQRLISHLSNGLFLYVDLEYIKEHRCKEIEYEELYVAEKAKAERNGKTIQHDAFLRTCRMETMALELGLQVDTLRKHFNAIQKEILESVCIYFHRIRMRHVAIKNPLLDSIQNDSSYDNSRL